LGRRILVLRTIASEIEIAAAPEDVWALLADFDSYSQWNTFMPEASGHALRGSWLRLSLRTNSGRVVRFRARILAAESPRVLSWEGRGWAWLPGLLLGQRWITIEPLPDQGSRVKMRTTFTGLLSSRMRWLDRYRSSFERMLQALKDRAEERA
jgi:hypothetical protein